MEKVIKMKEVGRGTEHEESTQDKTQQIEKKNKKQRREKMMVVISWSYMSNVHVHVHMLYRETQFQGHKAVKNRHFFLCQNMVEVNT